MRKNILCRYARVRLASRARQNCFPSAHRPILALTGAPVIWLAPRPSFPFGVYLQVTWLRPKLTQTLISYVLTLCRYARVRLASSARQNCFPSAHKPILALTGAPTQHRVRDAMHRVDPSGVAMRWMNSIPRRSYNVTEPLALWHIDGHHKLIR